MDIYFSPTFVGENEVGVTPAGSFPKSEVSESHADSLAVVRAGDQVEIGMRPCLFTKERVDAPTPVEEDGYRRQLECIEHLEYRFGVHLASDSQHLTDRLLSSAARRRARYAING